MPIYEFVCQACGAEFEKIQSFSDSSIPTCVKCQSTEVVRRVGRPAIHFKGSGWYITDSKKSNDNKNGTKSAADSSSSSKTESQPESKPESKTESTTTESKSESTTPKSAPDPVASD